MTHYLIKSQAQNRVFNQSRANDRHAVKQWFLYGAAVFAGAFIVGAKFLPMPVERTYDLVQIDATGESEIIDYNLTATDCGQFKARLENRGYHMLCEVAE